MSTEIVAFNSRDEVALFEEYFDKYLSVRTQSPIERISLTEAYDRLQTRKDGGRIFSALLDIHVNFLFLYLDVHSVGATWDQLLAKGKLEGGSLFDSKTRFYGKMEIHRFTTAYVLRYRALWDKLLGLMVLLFVPDEYEAFTNAKSKRLRFQKLAEKHQIAEEQFLKKLNDMLTSFDNAFPIERQGEEAFSDYSIVIESLDHNPQIELMKFWNAANGFISKFGKIFSKLPNPAAIKRTRSAANKEKEAVTF